ALARDAGATPAAAGLTAARGSWAQVGRRLASTRQLAVIAAPEMSKGADWSEVAVLAGELSASLNGGVLPLYSYGNAVGAYRVMANLGLHRLEELLLPRSEAGFGAVVQVGCDLARAYPADLLDPLFGGAARRLALASLPSSATEAADLAIALADPTEYTGTAVDGAGTAVALRAVHRAPTAVGAGDFFRALIQAPGRVDASAWQEAPVAGPIPPTAGATMPAVDGDALLMAVASPYHATDGALTRYASWTQHFESQPVLRLGVADAERRGLVTGRTAVVESDQGTMTMACQVDPSLPPGLMLAPAAFPEVRSLLPWELSADRLRCPPARARVWAATQEARA
ncbi:MAG: molybdopterin dinucleotide binding domain-containing protein, partial [Gemmatimonadota bacterium]